VAGFAGDGGSATHALLGPSLRLAFDDVGDLFFADADNNRIRRVDAASGVITTVAGNGSAGFGGDQGPATRAALNLPSGVAWHSGNLFVADQNNCVVRKVDVDGIITTVRRCSQQLRLRWGWRAGRRRVAERTDCRDL
jgi:sugar lactone lactonase YvrE